MRFQSTKPQRLRLWPVHRIIILEYFNPRSRKGFDLTVPFTTFFWGISIHEAAKASTLPSIPLHSHRKFQSTKPQRLRQFEFKLFVCFTDFNPRSRKGFDVNPDIFNCVTVRFQSTKPQRLRPFSADDILSHNDFNPRSRKGFD